MAQRRAVSACPPPRRGHLATAQIPAGTTTTLLAASIVVFRLGDRVAEALPQIHDSSGTVK